MPRPRSDLSEIRPPISWILLRTTSMPTPRPEISEIVSAVENPGAMMRLLISSSVSVASGPISPRSRAFLSTRSELIPAPSSRISMTIRPPRCSAREMDRPLLLLAGRQPVGRRLDAVVDRVADDMRQRIAEPLDDRAVDLGRLAGHLEPDPLGGLGRELAHEPRHALEHRADRLRAHRHHAVLQLAGVMDDLVEDLPQPAAASLPEGRARSAPASPGRSPVRRPCSPRGRSARARSGSWWQPALAAGALRRAALRRARSRRALRCASARARRRHRLFARRSRTSGMPASRRRRGSGMLALDAASSAGIACRPCRRTPASDLLPTISISQSPVTNSKTSSTCARVDAVRSVPVQPI